MSSNSYKNKRTIRSTGAIISAKLSRDHAQVTVWIEGRDRQEESVAGMALNAEQLDFLIKRLTNLRSEMNPKQTDVAKVIIVDHDGGSKLRSVDSEFSTYIPVKIWDEGDHQ
jgi:hypothetical protein